MSRHHVGSGRSEAVCAEAVCAPAARASPGLGARGFSGKFSGALLRLRGVGHAPSRPARLRGFLRPLGSGPAPSRRFCASPALPRGNRRRVPLGLDFRHCERWLPRLRGDLPSSRRMWPPGILRGAPQPRHTAAPHGSHTFWMELDGGRSGWGGWVAQAPRGDRRSPKQSPIWITPHLPGKIILIFFTPVQKYASRN